MNPFRKKKPAPTFPVYYRHPDGIYQRWESPLTFTKAFISNGEMRIIQQSIEKDLGNNMATITEGFKRIDRKEWDKFMEAIALRNVDLYGARKLEYAFTSGGVNFYTFEGVDGKNPYYDLPVGRFLEAQAVYHEMASVADREYLDALAAKLSDFLTGKDGQINVGAAAVAVEDLKHRLAIGFDATAYERLFAVLYVTEDEDIAKWDAGHSQWKIKHVRQHGGSGFFFNLPIRDLLPSGISSQEDLENFTRKVNLLKSLTLERLRAL